MLSGEPYQANDPELSASRRACQRLLEVFNTAQADDERSKHVLHQLLGSLGEGSVILPRFQCDYGAHITIGANCFLNYDAILLDCAPISIGDNVWLAAGVIVGPGVTIGANSIIGAGSVVISDIPAHVLAAGNPCRVIRGLP